jgi:hypothetical protein
MPLVTLPQFTEMESKIVGPLTFKQFLSLGITIGICVLVYNLFPHFISLPLSLILFILGVFLSFIKVEGIPLYNFLLLRLKSIFSPRVLFWGKKKATPFFLSEIEIKKLEKEKIKTKRESSLKNLVTKVVTKK